MKLQEETKESESKRLDVTLEPEVGDMCLEDRGRSSEPSSAGGLLNFSLEPLNHAVLSLSLVLEKNILFVVLFLASSSFLTASCTWVSPFSFSKGAFSTPEEVCRSHEEGRGSGSEWNVDERGGIHGDKENTEDIKTLRAGKFWH